MGRASGSATADEMDQLEEGLTLLHAAHNAVVNAQPGGRVLIGWVEWATKHFGCQRQSRIRRSGQLAEAPRGEWTSTRPARRGR